MSIFRKKREIIDTTDYSPEYSIPGSEKIVTTVEESWFSILLGWAKGILTFIIVGLAFIALLYSGMAAFVLTYTPLSPEPESPRSIVVYNPWSDSSGNPPIGEEAVISTSKGQPDDILGKIMEGWSGIPDPAVVKIESRYYDELFIKVTERDKKAAEELLEDEEELLPGQDISQMEVTNIESKNADKEIITGEFMFSPAYTFEKIGDKKEVNHRLDNEFLVSCVSGACGEPGTLFIVDQTQIYGQARVM